MPTQFPDDFLFGVGSSSYQIEGAHDKDGKGESIWDRYTNVQRDRILDESDGNDACKSYEFYKEDVEALKELKVQFYRFSISWVRICPNGDATKLNQRGIDYYNNLINLLIKNDIIPMVTLYHWELPQKLQDIGGWANPMIADFFEDYARVVFSLYGDRVKWWFTLNEPHLHSIFGHGHCHGQLVPVHAPDIKYFGVGEYLCGYTQLISHARVYRLYQKEFFEKQQGKVGIVLNIFNHQPASNKPEDIDAAERAKVFEAGWFLHPIFSPTGDYPPIMKQRVDANSKLEGRTRSRLRPLSLDEIELIKGSADFVGVNHYTTYLTSHDEKIGENPSFCRDAAYNDIPNPESVTLYPEWIKMEPEGFRDILNWLKDNYNNLPVFIAENGCGDVDPINDDTKVTYHKEYLKILLKAILEDGCNIIGYSAWSFLDSYEWTSGYMDKFGFYHVDFSDPKRKRTAKKSASFYRKVIESRSIDID